MARKKQEPEQIVPTGQLYVEPLEKVLHSSMLPYAESRGRLKARSKAYSFHDA